MITIRNSATPSRPIPALAGVDGQGRTVYIGSFSKIFSNSLRMGYIVAPDGLIDRLAQAMRAKGARASAMPQAALAEFMQQGEFYRHLRRVRRIYAERHRNLIESLRAGFGDVGQVVDHQARHAGGFASACRICGQANRSRRSRRRGRGRGAFGLQPPNGGLQRRGSGRLPQ